jgi:hypothetical protein
MAIVNFFYATQLWQIDFTSRKGRGFYVMLRKKRFTPLHPPIYQEFGAKDCQPFPAAEFRHPHHIVDLRAQFFKPYKWEWSAYT